MAEPKLREKQWDLHLEEKMLQAWDREPDLYAFDPSGGKPVFIIDTPPPYPSGTWHPGAVVAYAMIDALARSRRMLGRAVLFPFGLDRNGINIERTVEGKYGKPLHAWDRQEFIDKCREEIGAIGEGIQSIARRMGMSMDLARTYYTDREDYRAFSQAIFIDLWNRGLVYRGERPSIYCPVCGTPLAEADIEYEERDATLSWIRFPLDGGGAITIATTRPELLPACVALFFAPGDERYGRNLDLYLYHLDASTSLDPATIQVTGRMRYMEHGTFRQIALPVGEGHYLLLLQFPMPGEWQLELEITATGVQNTIYLDLNLFD